MFHRDESGELRRDHDNARMHRRRAPDPGRVAARKAGQKHYTDIFGVVRQTQNGNPVKARKKQLAPTERAGVCAVHKRTRFSIKHNECIHCLEENGYEALCIVHGWARHHLTEHFCLSCRTPKGWPRGLATNPVGFYVGFDGLIKEVDGSVK